MPPIRRRRRPRTLALLKTVRTVFVVPPVRSCHLGECVRGGRGEVGVWIWSRAVWGEFVCGWVCGRREGWVGVEGRGRWEGFVVLEEVGLGVLMLVVRKDSSQRILPHLLPRAQYLSLMRNEILLRVVDAQTTWLRRFSPTAHVV